MIKTFERDPTIQCLIKHLFEGSYDDGKNAFYTIFGRIKRVRIIGTIINKSEQLVETNDIDIGLSDDTDSNIRIIFDIDDSTGIIRATTRDINPMRLESLSKGDIVDVIGKVRKFGDYISLWTEIIRKVDDPNYKLLIQAEIIDKIKHGKLHEIPEKVEINDFSNDIEVNSLFESEDIVDERDEMKDKVYLIVEEYSARGDGINYEILKREVGIPDNKLRTILNDLILESRIYESNEDIFETF